MLACAAGNTQQLALAAGDGGAAQTEQSSGGWRGHALVAAKSPRTVSAGELPLEGFVCVRKWLQSDMSTT